MEFNGAIIKKICLGDRPVNKVRQTINGTDTLIWETTDAPEILLSNPRVVYANAGGYQYLSARGYSSSGSGEYANDYAYVIADVVYSYRGNTFKFLEGVQVDVTSVSETDTWLSVGHTGYAIVGSDSRAVAVAASRGTTVGGIRTGYITGISVYVVIDGTSRQIKNNSVRLAVQQQANARSEGASTTEYERVTFINTNDEFCITTTDFTESSKCPASGSEDGRRAVVSAQAWVIKTVRQRYTYTSGATSSTDTQTRTAVPADRFRFFLARAVGNPYADASIEPGITSTEEGGWEYDDGTVYGNNQRVVLFEDMGTDEYPNGRYVDVNVEVINDDGGIYRLADNESNTIRLYQAANAVTNTRFVNPVVNTLSISNWNNSGSSEASPSGEIVGEADWAVITADVTATRRQTYSSGSYKDTAGIALDFESPTMRIVIPTTFSSWINTPTVDGPNTAIISVKENEGTAGRNGYVYLETSSRTFIGNVYIYQSAEDDGGEEPED